MIRPSSINLLAGSALLLATACQAAQPAATAGATNSHAPATVSTASAERSPPTTQPSSAGENPAPEPSGDGGEFGIGDGDFFLADPHVGLDALAGYTQTLTVAFEGTASGQTQSWSRIYRLRHSADPNVTVLNLEVSGGAVAPDPASFAEAAGASYQRGADGTCAGQPFDSEQSSIASREPAGLLPGLLGAQEAGAETVNGIAATHYTFDEQALLEPGVETNGEIWSASDGGYVLKFLRTTTADAAYFGDGLDGTMTWDYELTDVNGQAAVTLPDGCQLDVPIMAEATNVLVLARYAGFETQSSIGEVIDFYEAEMPALGWDLKSDPTKSADRAFVEFVKGDDALDVLITPGEDGLKVDLALIKGS